MALTRTVKVGRRTLSLLEVNDDDGKLSFPLVEPMMLYGSARRDAGVFSYLRVHVQILRAHLPQNASRVGIKLNLIGSKFSSNQRKHCFLWRQQVIGSRKTADCHVKK